MKKSIFVFILLCLGKVGMWQQINLPENFLNDSLTLEWNDSVTENPMLLVDSVFKLIHPDSISTGILIDKSIVVSSYEKYKGDSLADDTCTYQTLLQLYGSLYWGNTDTSVQLPYVADYDSIAQLYIDSGYAPIGLVMVPYNKTKSNAFTDSLLVVDGIQVQQNSPWRGNPFEVQTIFASSAILTEYDSSLVKFILPEELIANTTGESIVRMEANFDDGNGFVPLTVNGEVTIDYVSPTVSTPFIELGLNWQFKYAD
ncbi:MAG: hypothetical protein IT247_01560 [Bacteroidia bacterium]|nr:hypothetical protein [Bacteroidia bacterium]